MAAAATYSGVASFISNLARQHDPARDSSFSAQIAANGAKTAANSIILPGPDCLEKTELEKELAALCARVDFLERKSSTATNPEAFPPTPAQEQPDDLAYTPSGATRSNGPAGHARRGSNRERAQWVSNWLAAKESNGGTEDPAAALTEEQLNYLRSHLNQQADQVSSCILLSVSASFPDPLCCRLRTNANTSKLSPPKSRTNSLRKTWYSNTALKTLALSNESLGNINSMYTICTRSCENYTNLTSPTRANLAFQKALREIGAIVTAVAMGDLSKKVLIHAKEMDPEITLFKRTINTMVDQLQEFASQVTFLAREVGTEGRLGGQANLPGVAGIWAELTDSGMLYS